MQTKPPNLEGVYIADADAYVCWMCVTETELLDMANSSVRSGMPSDDDLICAECHRLITKATA